MPAARHDRIRSLIREHGIVSLQEVKADLGVSEMTIRRDFAALEQQGVLQRTRGGVMAAGRVVSDRDYGERERLERGAKEAIGRVAATLVEDGDTIFLSGGTTLLELARALIGRHEITVVTNSVQAVSELIGAPGMAVISTGGVASSKGEDMSGPVAEATISRLRARKAFIGASGITPDGVFNAALDRAAVDQLMVAGAGEVYVLADHTKVGHVSLALVTDLQPITALVTDAEVPKAQLQWLRKAGVKVLVGGQPTAMGGGAQA